MDLGVAFTEAIDRFLFGTSIRCEGSAGQSMADPRSLRFGLKFCPGKRVSPGNAQVQYATARSLYLGHTHRRTDGVGSASTNISCAMPPLRR